MKLLVVLRPEASLDIEETRDYFDEQQSGLGHVFLDKLNELLNRIGTSPSLYAVVWKNVRAGRLRRFPYVVYYRVHVGRIEVLAVVHGRRDPCAWKSRDQPGI